MAAQSPAKKRARRSGRGDLGVTGGEHRDDAPSLSPAAPPPPPPLPALCSLRSRGGAVAAARLAVRLGMVRLSSTSALKSWKCTTAAPCPPRHQRRAMDRGTEAPSN
ncbi:unnamed protein product, partial [Closterium sp. Yama58-4]